MPDDSRTHTNNPPTCKGSALGTAAVTVMDKSVDMIAAIRRLSHFYRCASVPLL